MAKEIWYEPEYYAYNGEHGNLKAEKEFKWAFKEAKDLYKREEKNEDGSCKDVSYIGVNTNGDVFGIVYMTKEYLNSTDEKHFKDKKSYENWKNVAEEVFKTGKPMKGSFSKGIMAEGGDVSISAEGDDKLKICRTMPKGDVKEMAEKLSDAAGEMATGGLTPAKAKQILHDGEIRGNKLTDAQRKFFGARASGYPIKHGDGGEMTDDRIEDILNHYIMAALWSSNDDNDEPLDSIYSKDDIDEKTIARMERDVRRFVEENYDLLDESELSDEQIGHDLWLTRNHHGAGFWDRGLPKELGKKLTDAAHGMKEAIIEVGDDGKLHQLGGKEFKTGGDTSTHKSSAMQELMNYYAANGAIITGGNYSNDKHEMAKGGKVYSQKRVAMTKRGKGIDKKVKAKKSGWRKSKVTGDSYFESRSNRSDKNPKTKI